jgi:DMSO/TMAO reductase YedYZ molybdopterin-dependent catalytic subunit
VSTDDDIPEAPPLDPQEEVRRLLVRADDVRKAAPQRPRPEEAWEQAAELLDQARAWVEDIDDDEVQRSLGAQISRRWGDLDLDALAPMLEPSPDAARAPTTVDDPGRIPPGQHLTPGWPVLHVGSVPDLAPEDVRLVVTGLVEHRQVLTLEGLRALPVTKVTRDLHCVTRWTRLDNTWAGVRVGDVLDLARPRPAATHAVVSGHPAYSTNLDIEVLREDDVLLAWEHDGAPLAAAHGGPLRLVVPSRYGWKSVKWVQEIRLIDRDVPGYWEVRGYHDVGDPWSEQRFSDDA